MARKAKWTGILKPADKLKPSRSDEIFQKICAWEQEPTVTHGDVIAWLSGVCETLENGIELFRSTIEQIRDGDELFRERQASVFEDSCHFLNRTTVAAKLLAGEPSGNTLDAFTEGVRIGLIHERLMSLIDGRYSEKWLREKSRKLGGKGTEVLTADADKFLLQTAYAKFGGQKKVYQKIANELYRHGIKGRGGKRLSDRTIKTKLQEMGYLENA